MSDTSKTAQALEEFSQRALGDVKVLMIEDDPFVTEMVLTKLSQHGCIPYSGLTGEEAIGLAEQFSPDVIILDLMLPGVSGEEILEQLKADDTLKSIPVVVFSNKSDEESMQRCLALGAAEYLVKASTDINTIPEVIARILHKL